MKTKVICIAIISIFILMGFTVAGTSITKDTKNSNNSPVIKYCKFEFISKPQWNYVKVIASDSDGDAIRFGLDSDKDREVDEWTEYYSDHTRLGVKEYLYDMLIDGDVFVVVEDEHGAQSEWINPAENPKTKTTPIPDTIFVHGYITEHSGLSNDKPISGAKVQLVKNRFSNEVISEYTSLSSGYYELTAPARENLVIRLTKPGYFLKIFPLHTVFGAVTGDMDYDLYMYKKNGKTKTTEIIQREILNNLFEKLFNQYSLF